MKRYMKLAAIPAVAALMSLGGFAIASAASAQTTECSASAAGFCGAQVNAFSNAWTVPGIARVNTLVSGSPLNTTDGSQDFTARQTTADQNERQFEYTPGLTPTGLCLSNPSGKTVSLRACNTGGWQQFTGVDPGDTAGTTWTDNATHNLIVGNGTSKPLVAIPSTTNTGGSRWGFTQAATAP